MALFKSASLLTLISCSWIFHPVFCGGPRDVKASLGQTVTLTCQSHDRVPFAAVEWTRSDLKPTEYVYLYRDGHPNDPTHQHPSFKNRVELRDGEMKNGDLSLILKNVTKDDSGTYQCRFKADETRRRRMAVILSEPISTIRLQVLDPAGMDQQDHKEPDPERPAGLGPAAVGGIVTLVVVAAGFFIYRRRRSQT